jgi:hypothetical protein
VLLLGSSGQVAGTAKGITAVQLDTKLPGVDLHLLAAALEPAAAARQQLLQHMTAAVAEQELGLATYDSPQHGCLEIMKELVPRLIGPQVRGGPRGAGRARTSGVVAVVVVVVVVAGSSKAPSRPALY